MASNTPTLLLNFSRISPKIVGVYPPLNDAVKISRTRNIAILGTRSVIQSESITEFIEKCDLIAIRSQNGKKNGLNQRFLSQR